MRTTVTKTISIPPGVAHELEAKAAELGVPESTIARWALEKFCNMRTVDVSIGRRTKKRKKGN